MVRSLTDRLSAFLGRAPRPPEEDQEPRERCLACDASLADTPLYEQYRVCPSCRFHFNLTARERVSLLADPSSFRENHRSIVSLEPASSVTPSKQRPRGESRRTGLTEAAITGRCSIGGRPVVLIVLDFRFVGGTIGAVVGEKVSLAFELATRRKLPVVAVVTSGTTGIQEGVISLMQMAKASFALNSLGEEGLPFITVMANPTTGQVYSSFATLADVILAEPGSLLGLAPARSSSTGSQSHASAGIHSAEAHLARGMIDRIIDREKLRDLLSVLLDLMTPKQPVTEGDSARGLPAPKLEERIGEQRLEELWPPAWESVQLARHEGQRPTSLDFIRRCLSGFVELHGDRLYGDDPSVVAGIGDLGGQTVAVIGQERGHDLTARERHEGRIYPEGFRKAQRLMRLASKLQIPLLTFIDTSGPYYGKEAEERGIGSAISSTMALMAQLPVPTISVVVGEGGSEGALAMSIADRILMLERAVYNVTSPEVATAMLHHENYPAAERLEPLRLTAHDCRELEIIDLMVPEPSEGANINPSEAAALLKTALEEEMTALMARSTKRILRDRYRKFRKMGEYSSHFRVALSREASTLQGYMAQGVRLIRRRPRRRPAALPDGEDKGG